jgi:serine/threonine protein kinase
MWFGTPETKNQELWALVKEHFDIGPVFGQGKDGTILRRGVHKLSGRAAAFKIIPTPIQKSRDRAVREAQLLQMVSPHRNIVELFAVYEARAEVVIVTEFCSRGDLLERVNHHGKFSEEETRKMFKQVIAALLHCYDCGIAHRDVKLDNVFIQWDPLGKEEVLKLGDFGFAEQFDRECNRFRSSCGTLNYAAPELLVPRGMVDIEPEPADVWSAGVVLYGILNGVLPFQAKEPVHLVERIRSGSYYINPNFSEGLKEQLKLMLSIDPRRRATLLSIYNSRWLLGAPKRPAEEPIMRELHVSVGELPQDPEATSHQPGASEKFSIRCTQNAKRAESTDSIWKKIWGFTHRVVAT